MSTAPQSEPTAVPEPAACGISEVRYALPELLREVEDERNAPAFAMEKLDRTEIAKLFSRARPRRVLKDRK